MTDETEFDDSAADTGPDTAPDDVTVPDPPVDAVEEPDAVDASQARGEPAAEPRENGEAAG